MTDNTTDSTTLSMTMGMAMVRNPRMAHPVNPVITATAMVRQTRTNKQHQQIIMPNHQSSSKGNLPHLRTQGHSNLRHRKTQGLRNNTRPSLVLAPHQTSQEYKRVICLGRKCISSNNLPTLCLNKHTIQSPACALKTRDTYILRITATRRLGHVQERSGPSNNHLSRGQHRTINWTKEEANLGPRVAIAPHASLSSKSLMICHWLRITLSLCFRRSKWLRKR